MLLKGTGGTPMPLAGSRARLNSFRANRSQRELFYLNKKSGEGFCLRRFEVFGSDHSFQIMSATVRPAGMNGSTCEV